jgi:hypothetical protein
MKTTYELTDKQFRKMERKYRSIKLRVVYRPEDDSLTFFTSPLDSVTYAGCDFKKQILDLIKRQI